MALMNTKTLKKGEKYTTIKESSKIQIQQRSLMVAKLFHVKFIVMFILHTSNPFIVANVIITESIKLIDPLNQEPVKIKYEWIKTGPKNRSTKTT